MILSFLENRCFYTLLFRLSQILINIHRIRVRFISSLGDLGAWFACCLLGLPLWLWSGGLGLTFLRS